MINEFKSTASKSMHIPFQEWRKENPSAYFLTQKSEKTFILHSSLCWHQGSPDYQGPHDMAKALKVCSESKDELHAWAGARLVAVSECRHCVNVINSKHDGISIHQIVESINSRAEDYEIGNLQAIRKEIKNFKRQPGSQIFSDVTTSDDGWAFHFGGRREIQFNVGLEKEGIRYGLAFSLEPSQSLPDIDDLLPKIQKLNVLIRDRPDLFRDYQFWYWHPDFGRSQIMPVVQITPAITKKNYFIFIGRIIEESKFDPDLILTHFDQMLQIYLEVESLHEDFDKLPSGGVDEFSFKVEPRNLIESKSYSTAEKIVDVDVRHSLIQKTLYSQLVKQYGVDNVSLENPFNGNRIDAVARTPEGFIFYEIKVAISAKACLRQALGQLMEYAYWPGKLNAIKIIAVGEPELNETDSLYLRFLKEKFNLPIEYISISPVDITSGGM